MNGSITFYADNSHQPRAGIGKTGNGHLYLDDFDAYAPSLLIQPEDVRYLDWLAAVATELAAMMRATDVSK